MSNHIKEIFDDTLSICGELLGAEFYFKSIDAAVLNGKHESSTVACHACSIKLIELLKKGMTKTCQRSTNDDG